MDKDPTTMTRTATDATMTSEARINPIAAIATFVVAAMGECAFLWHVSEGPTAIDRHLAMRMAVFDCAMAATFLLKWLFERRRLDLTLAVVALAVAACMPGAAWVAAAAMHAGK